MSPLIICDVNSQRPREATEAEELKINEQISIYEAKQI